MNVGYLTIAMIILSMVACGVGAFGIAKYAFRISSGKGVAVLLLPPYTFYFSFYELQEEGKEKAISLWMGGLVVTLIMIAAFWGPVSMVLNGEADKLYPTSADEMAAEYGKKPVSAELLKPIADLEVPQNQAVAGTNNGTAGTNNGTAGTNGAATNGAATNNGTNSAAPATNAAPAAAP